MEVKEYVREAKGLREYTQKLQNDLEKSVKLLKQVREEAEYNTGREAIILSDISVLLKDFEDRYSL